MNLRRAPGPRLAPFVSVLWASTPAPGSVFATPMREHVLPGGAIHLVLRLNDAPLYVLDGEGGAARALDPCLVGGVRSRFYARELLAPSASVGAVLRPGGARALLGAPADAFAERHSALEDVWGLAARGWRDAIAACATPQARLDLFEAALLERLSPAAAPQPGIAAALAAVASGAGIAQAAALSGVSHRHFIVQVREAVGLTPKTYARVLRLRRALALAATAPRPAWAAIAAGAGYSDQSHFSREFLAMTGVTPGAYGERAPIEPHHLPVEVNGAVKNLQDSRRARR